MLALGMFRGAVLSSMCDTDQNAVQFWEVNMKSSSPCSSGGQGEGRCFICWRVLRSVMEALVASASAVAQFCLSWAVMVAVLRTLSAARLAAGERAGKVLMK